MSLRATSQISSKFRKSEILLENINNKSPSAVRSGTKSCRVNMTVLLSFEEKKQMTLARAHNRDTVPLKSIKIKKTSQQSSSYRSIANLDAFPATNTNSENFVLHEITDNCEKLFQDLVSVQTTQSVRLKKNVIRSNGLDYLLEENSHQFKRLNYLFKIFVRCPAVRNQFYPIGFSTNL